MKHNLRLMPKDLRLSTIIECCKTGERFIIHSCVTSGIATIQVRYNLLYAKNRKKMYKRLSESNILDNFCKPLN